MTATKITPSRKKLRRKEYNEERPHSSLGYRSPAEFTRLALTSPGGAGGSGAVRSQSLRVDRHPIF